uniref:Methionine synthase reductase n=1 Tax=Culex pipiens TaxID=7175 RepID=A0A8D8KME1_CULPI
MLNLAELVEKYGDNLTIPPAPVKFIKLVDAESDEEQPKIDHLQSSCIQPFCATRVFQYKILNHKIIAQGEDIKTVYDVVLTTDSEVDYRWTPGDTVGILTKNLDEDVDSLVDHLDLQSTQHKLYRVEVDPATKKKAAKVPVYIPKLAPLRKLFSECLDLKSIPKKLFIRALLDFTEDEAEKRLLSLLCSKDSSAFDDVVLKTGMSFLTLLQNVPGCKPPVSVLIEHLPRLMPRPYSIANAHGEGGKIRILFSMSESCPGLTTSFLRSCCDTKDPVFLYFRNTTHFNYKEDDLPKDIVMIGVGTGIAPYLGILDHRRNSKEAGSLGKAWLFAGFRHEETSYLCRDELSRCLKDNILNDLSVAFSRDPNAHCRYVQDQLEANKERVVQTLRDADGKLYVCGDGKMMLPQVEGKIGKMLAEVLCISDEQVKALIKEWKTKHKYIEDVWL